MVTFHIITLFPEVVKPYMNESILGRAQADGHIAVKYYNPRDYTSDERRRIDRKPYGGGPGMVIEAEPVIKAIDHARGRKKDVLVIHLSPAGEQFDNTCARSTARRYRHVVIVAGRYEGVDARVMKAVPGKVFSVGPYILTGGELPAMIITDAISRQAPGVLGDPASLEEERTASPDVYTRPEEFMYKRKKFRVPRILLSGHHKDIEAWKQGRKEGGRKKT